MTTAALERRFTLEDQAEFAALSGDFNPMHVDPIAARRLLYGRPIVHGVHLLLWALDRASSARGKTLLIERLSAEFRKPVAVDVPATLRIEPEADKDTCEVLAAGAVAARIEVTWTEVDLEPAARWRPAAITRDVPRDVPAEGLADARGILTLAADHDLVECRFPSLAARVSLASLAELLATTRLIGMTCPGLHSIYKSMALERTSDTAPNHGELRYAVERYDARFRLARIGVRGPTLGGVLEAFHRPAPMAQSSAAELAALVRPGEFARMSALVVGGSRGIGEVAAKLLAAGGARVALTFARGAEEASAVRDDIRSNGGHAEAFALDATDAAASTDAIREYLGTVTHLLYFASTPIFVAERTKFDPALFEAFCRVYVAGFSRLVDALLPLGLSGALYPSSVAVEELPADMGEYAAAKAAGESLCAYLAKTRRGLGIRVPRLPRIATDQTRSLAPVKDRPAAEVLLPELRGLAA